MEPDLYAPPRAPTADLPADGIPTFMDRVPKPIAAWLVQGVCTIVLAFELFLTLRLLLNLMSGAPIVRWWMVPFSLAFNGAVLAWFGYALVGTQRRASHGRVLGLAVLGLWMVACVVGVVQGIVRDERMGMPAAYEAGELLGFGLVLLLNGWWIHAFGFSRKARAWFRMPLAAADRAEHWRP